MWIWVRGQQEVARRRSLIRKAKFDYFQTELEGHDKPDEAGYAELPAAGGATPLRELHGLKGKYSL
jgi:hypothetical protein